MYNKVIALLIYIFRQIRGKANWVNSLSLWKISIPIIQITHYLFIQSHF